MTDLISRADAIDAVASITMSIHLSEVICDKLLALPSADAVMRDATAEERASVQRYIDSISTEAVQVVRCKDCKYCWYDDDTDSLECRHNKGLNEEIYGNDFCCYGERREE